MKKSRFLGFALTLAATMVVGGAMGQTDPTVAGGANFVQIGSTLHADKDQNTRSFVSVGGKLGFYVLPDLAYSPNYNAAGSWALNADHDWSFTMPGGSNITYVKGDGITNPKNFVEITATATATTGANTITYAETVPASFGCDPAAKTFSLVVIPTPTVSFLSTSGRPLGSGKCGDAEHELTLNVKATHHIKVKMSYDVHTVSFDPTTHMPVYAAVAGKQNVAASASFTDNNASDQVPASSTWSIDANTFDYATSTGNVDKVVKFKMTFPLESGKTTRYQFHFQAAPTDGVNDFVTRKSFATVVYNHDNTTTFTADTKYYGGSGTLDVFVMAPPVTGPVYHINNNVAK